MLALADVEVLADEVRLHYHALVRLAGALHGGLRVTPPMRAVLEFLQARGPTPVPRIARSRGVSRQHIQTIVNELLHEGLVELRDNPAHRRSCLVALTAAGHATIAGIRDTERIVLSESTVKTHVKRLMAKLGLTSRAQAVVVAYESGLVVPGQ